MTSSRTPAIPTPGRAAEAAHWRRGAALLAACLPLWAGAHGTAAEPVPDEVGLRAGVAAAVTYLRADAVLPSARLDGFVLQGDEGVDRRRWGLEHGVLDVGWRFHPQWAAYAAVGKHDSDRPHTEAFWLQARQPQGDATWLLSAGRQRPALGAVLETAGHFDRFSQVPLAQRATLNGSWIDDGVQLGWRGEVAGRPVALDAGLWRGQVFPGARQGSAVPALHVGTQVGDVAIDAVAARFAPRGRGTRTSSFGAGHSHAAPICDDSTRGQVACFDGHSDLAAASARWQSPDWPLTVSAAGWLRRDRGDVASGNGSARYRSTQRGGWLEGVWQFHPQLEAGLRVERLQARHALSGPGAALLASELRLNRYQPAQRTVWMLGYTPRPGLDVRLELGRESVAGQRVRYAMLRALWQFDTQLAP